MSTARIYRMYKNSVQRVLLSSDSLNSNAAFLIIVHDEKKVFSWIGSNCDTLDIDNVNDLGVTVLKRDFFQNDIVTIDMIREGEEKKNLLEIMLDLFGSNSSSYFSKVSIKSRKESITNNPVSVGIIESSTLLIDTYDFNETNFTHPDVNGKISRLSFVPIEIDTIAYVNIGDHWDLWIARGVKKEVEMKVIEYLKHKIILNLQLNDNNLIEYKDLLLSQYIDIIYQGEEHVLFRRALKIFTNYEPKNKTLSRSINNEITTARNNYKNRYNNYFNNNDGNSKIDYDDNENSKNDDDNNVTFSMIGNDESKITEKKDNKNNLKNNVSSNNSINNNSVNNNINSDDILLTDDKVDFWKFKPMTDDTNNNNLSTTNSTALNKRSDNVEIPYLPIIKYEATTNSVGIDEAYITSNMFDINESFTITPLDRKKIIDTAVIDPSSLIGYQV